MLTLLFGIYRAMYADATMWEVAKTLFSFTINPGIEFFNELEVRQSELLTGGVSYIHLLPLSLIVPLPPLLHTHHHHTYPCTPTQPMVVRTPPPFPTYPKPLGCIDALIPAASLSQLPILTNVLQVVWIMLGNVVLLNVIIAMMNSTYGQATHTSTIPAGVGIGLLPFFVSSPFQTPAFPQVFDQQEARWRLQFLQQVLFQEATPQFFIPPFLGVKVTARPGHHIKSTLVMTSADGVKSTAECFFLQMIKEHENQDRYADSIDETAEALRANGESLRMLQASVERIESHLGVAGGLDSTLKSSLKGEKAAIPVSERTLRAKTSREKTRRPVSSTYDRRRPSMESMADFGEGLKRDANYSA